MARLPSPAYPLVGRRSELAQLKTWLGDANVRLMTLVGPGGIGKTRLAQEATSLWGQALAWVRLEDVRPGEHALLSRLGQTLELPECGWDEWHTRLDTVLSGSTLIVFDNLEHLREQAGQLTELLERHPQLRLLATSRAPLLLAGERLLHLDPLDEPTATRLLMERARAVRPDFVVNDQNREAVEELCRRLDGIPLCLELAAARLRHLGLVELNASLEDSIELLSGGGPDRPARQQTLANTLDWSFGLLSPALQQSFLRLAVFRGSFTHQAAAEVGCPRPDLLELADQSLVATRHSLAGESRFALLETVRAYVGQRLGDDPEVRQAHARHYLGLAGELEAWRGGRGHAAGLKRLALERANLMQALENLAGPQALELAGLLGWYWEACSLLEEGRRAIEGLLPQGESALALHFLATLMRHQGDYIGAGGHYRRALELWQDQARASETLSGLAQLRFREGDYRAAGELFEQARQQGDSPRQVDALNGLGRVAWVEGRLDEAVELEHQSLRLAQQQEYPLGEAWAHNALGEVHRSRRERGQASRHFRSAADLFTELHEFSLAALALQNLAYVELGQQSWEEAGNGFREALGLWRRAGARHGLALCLIGLAGVLAGQGRDRLGARFLGAADQLLASIGVKLEASDSQDYGEIESRLRKALGPSLAQVRTENIGLETLLKELDSHQLEGLEGLTSREVEVLRVTATGVSNKEIAEALSISPQTVMVHLRSIYRKLGVPSRTAAARWASDHGLTPAD